MTATPWRPCFGPHALPLTLRPYARAFEHIEEGSLTLEHGESSWRFGAHDGRLHATLQLQRPLTLLWSALRRGDVGFAESYLDGHWRSDDLTTLLELLARNEARITKLNTTSTWGDRLRHSIRANSLRGSRRNIAHHYDLGNDFYALWLDEGMTYSAAMFINDEPVGVAQLRKYHDLLERLDAAPGSRILEIGCGWGGFAELAARRGYRIDGITLSRAQLEYARRRLQRIGASDSATLALRDYRDIQDCYDHIVSIEMFEAVGQKYWPVFFDTVQRALRPGGRVALQVITIDEASFASYRANPDFIQRYIFPGGMLPSVERFEASARRAGFKVRDLTLAGEDYARTLAIWARRFAAAEPQVRALGFGDRFIRMWRYYLAYCEAGFRSGRVNLARVTLEKPA